LVRDADELHDVLLSQGASPAHEGAEWSEFFETLRAMGRATHAEGTSGPPLWVATERWSLVRAGWPQAVARPHVTVPSGVRSEWSREEAIVHLVRGRVECLGPTTAAALAQALGLDATDVDIALATLENEGVVLRGRFSGAGDELEWCERRLLARIH